MPSTRSRHQPLPLLQGTVDVLILKALARAPMHGYGISQWIRQRAHDALAVEDAALYQALHRLERKGWIESEWGVSEHHRRARFYALAKSGRQQLHQEVVALRRYFEALFLVLDAP
jgi:transcriptional regulator